MDLLGFLAGGLVVVGVEDRLRDEEGGEVDDDEDAEQLGWGVGVFIGVFHAIEREGVVEGWKGKNGGWW